MAQKLPAAVVHVARPLWHVSEQRPAAHAYPAAHAVPHSPQLLLSDATWTH